MRSPLILPLLLGIAGCAVTEPRAPSRALHIETVATSGSPDWFEVVNASHTTVDLSDFVYVDAEGDLDRAAAFPAVELAPGERYVQRVSRATSGFQLGKDEELWIYRAEDGELSDGIVWRHR